LIEDYLFKHKKLHRLEMAVTASWDQGLKWAKSLKFEREGLMKKWSHDKVDHVLFARVL